MMRQANNIFLVSDFVEEIGELKSSEELITKVNEPGISNYIVCWMRLVASAELQKQPDFYINFLPNVASVHDFCRLVSYNQNQSKKMNKIFRRLNLLELILITWSLPPWQQV